jgi:hypothetical protein
MGGRVESYFLKINDKDAERALWVKATTLTHDDTHGADAVAEAWVIAFERGKPAVAAKATVSLSQARFVTGPDTPSPSQPYAEMPGLSVSRSHVRGKVGGVGIDLVLEDSSAPLVQYPHAWMYSGPFPSTKLVSPMPDLRATGKVELDGRTWTIDGWRGLLGHNWGRGHAFMYAWGHCNVWDERDNAERLVFEGTSARVRAGRMLTPMATLLLVRHANETHALTRFRQMFRNHGSMTFRRWQFSGSGPTIKLQGEMWADTDDMVGLRYENPDGAMTYCLNSKLASARLEVELERGRSFVATSRAAALEIGTRDPDHGVEMVL